MVAAGVLPSVFQYPLASIANFIQIGYTIGSPYYRTEVGAFENSESPYGTFDQGGNVGEWIEAIQYHESSRGLRGGSFASDNDIVLYAGNRGNGYGYPTYELYHVGFRVSEVPEPATAVLLLAGGLILVRRRRSRV